MRTTICFVLDVTRSPTVGYSIISDVPGTLDRASEDCLDEILWDRLLMADHLHELAETQ